MCLLTAITVQGQAAAFCQILTVPATRKAAAAEHRCSLILPANWVMPVWLALIFKGASSSQECHLCTDTGSLMHEAHLWGSGCTTKVPWVPCSCFHIGHEPGREVYCCCTPSGRCM